MFGRLHHAISDYFARGRCYLMKRCWKRVAENKKGCGRITVLWVLFGQTTEGLCRYLALLASFFSIHLGVLRSPDRAGSLFHHAYPYHDYAEERHDGQFRGQQCDRGRYVPRSPRLRYSANTWPRRQRYPAGPLRVRNGTARPQQDGRLYAEGRIDRLRRRRFERDLGRERLWKNHAAAQPSSARLS